ncbi:MAG: hypothetical protein H7Y30_10610 [Pyrinomonadaceae bacterium]|nr:hypothetical protein [Pyrinomonadaceae bacterium]
MLRFSEGENYFELEVSPEEDANLPSFDDAHVTVEVCSNGFRGHNDLWVSSNSLHDFCRALVALEVSRQGMAQLESISPGELQVNVHSVTSRGHIAVSGKMGYLVQHENGSFWHAVEFGFEFDPSQLASAVKLPWVSRYVA